MIQDQNDSKTNSIPADYIRSGLIEFAKLGLSMIYIANGSAIIAILSALAKFDTSEKYTIYLTISLFLLGLGFAVGATFSAYMTHRNLTENEYLRDGKEIIAFRISLFCTVLSFLFFVIGSIEALQLIA